ncbi:hypothetical protein TI39_contig459g00008 [Zymoseptoria brevis]|uniref:AA1-like domain-containing protein n=1 Tax=Zymoseptoria brevis TaxID=1047168 RepID=A0A0F4GK62_9PEZI|nr:hypothetical protein TI39_contig459g00008 [Zymoseptoria brevis]
MLALLLLAVLGRFAAALSAPQRPGCPIENDSWTIKNLVVFAAAASKPAATTQQHPVSFMTFEFHDDNKGLKLQTSCYRESNTSAISDPNNYYACENVNVRFKFDGVSLQVVRGFQNNCLGKPPYDHGDAFGEADTNLVVTPTFYGTLGTQDQQSVPITRLAMLKTEEE